MPLDAVPARSIPLFYRIFFLYYDPAVCLWGMYMQIFTPARVLTAYNPTASYDPSSHNMLFQQLTGHLFVCIILSVFLLRSRPADVYAWKVVQAALLSVDAVLLWSFAGSLGGQGRRSVGLWTADDWGCVAVTALAAVVRAGFVAGLGFGK